MPRRMFIVLCTLSSVNLVVSLTCASAVAHAPGGGVEGLGSALIGFCSIAFSVLLTGFGYNQLLIEIRKKAITGRTVAAIALAAAPLLIIFFVEVLPTRLRSRQRGFANPPARVGGGIGALCAFKNPRPAATQQGHSP